MKKVNILISSLLLIGLLAACSNNNNESLNDELPTLDVDFDVPETADPGDEVNLTAHVTYDDEPEEDAEVVFEIWESGHEDDSEKVNGKNEGGGDYTADYTFDEEAVYEMYAHTDGQGMHTMPKKEIKVGDAEESDGEDDQDSGEAGFHTEGFDLDFDEPEDVKQEKETALTTHITLNDEEMEDLEVRYEIATADDESETEWVDAEEDVAGEYKAAYTFSEEGNYVVTIHVKDDKDLHEHAEYEITVE